MATIFELMGTIAINNNKALSAIDQTTDQAKAMGSKLESTFTKTGKVLTTLGTGLTKIGSSLTNHITKPALIAGTALAGVTLAKGWARMTEIDNARAKLRALGNSGDNVKEIMNNALASVKGTAYGMDEAATTAASAVASGIKPGKQLEGYLRAVADTAAVAGVSMSEMGSIFNKVAAKGKVDAEILNQLSDAGVPALQLLAKQLGVTSVEVSEMVSRGEVDFATFQAAMQAGMDGAAVEMGSTTITGAIANINASIGRIGENFLGSADDANSFAGRVLPLLDDFRDWLGKGEEKAKQWGATFGEVVGAVVRYVRDGNRAMMPLSATAGKIFSVLRPIIDRIKDIAEAFSQLSPKMQATLIGGIIAAGPVITIFGKLFTVTGSIISGIGTLSATFGTMAGATGAATGAAGGLAGGLGAMLGPIALIVAGVIALIAVFVALYSRNEEFRNSVGEIWENIKETIGTVIEAIKATFTAFVELVGAIWSQWGDEITNVITTVFGVIRPIVEAGMDFIQAIIKTVTAIINGDWSGAWEGIKAVAGAAWDFIKALISGALSIIGSIISNLLSIIGGIMASIWDGIKTKVSEVWEGIKTAITNKVESAKESVRGKLEALKAFFSFDALISKVKTKWDELKNKIVSPIETAKTKIQNAIEKIKSFFNINLKFKSIKMPHVSVSWKTSGALAKAAQFIGLDGIPKFDVSWYAKGGIFNKPTLFNTPYGLKGVGEAGSEAVAPIATLQRYVADAVRMQNGEMVDILKAILLAIKQLDDGMYQAISAALDDKQIKWNDRELGRFVNAYAR